MKLYLSKGVIWTGTQADAKAAQGGNDYEPVEVPVDKPGLLTWLNHHWQRFTAPEASTEPVEHDDELPAPIVPPKRAPSSNGFCGECGRTAIGHHKLKQGDIMDAIIDAVSQLDQPWALKRVAEAIEERGGELTPDEA